VITFDHNFNLTNMTHSYDSSVNGDKPGPLTLAALGQGRRATDAHFVRSVLKARNAQNTLYLDS
jgi:hypothetical protein